jgi:hypothetical protein
MSKTYTECVLPEDMIWEDCDRTGHEESCFVMVCPFCLERFYDCEVA